jgi:hypothetical protein
VRVAEEPVVSVEDDFSDYQSTRDLEGGPHQGRSDPSRGMLLAAVAAVTLLVAGGVALVLIG